MSELSMSDSSSDRDLVKRSTYVTNKIKEDRKIESYTQNHCILNEQLVLSLILRGALPSPRPPVVDICSLVHRGSYVDHGTSPFILPSPRILETRESQGKAFFTVRD